MLAELIMTVTEISITASIAIILLMLASPFIKKHFKAKWRYIIWLVLSFRLIIMFNISLPEPPVNLTIPLDTATIRTVDDVVNAAQPVLLTGQKTQDIMQSDPIHTYSLLEVLAYVWLIGIAIFILYQFAAYISFKRKIKQQCSHEADVKILSLLDKLCIELSIKKKPDIWRCNNACSPMMFGFIKPALFLPGGNYDDCDLEVILWHELIHYKRCDLWYKLILLFANAVHWFNPLVYAMVKMACEDIEFSCDDEVVKNADIDFRKRYSQAILHSMHKERLQNTDFSTHFKGGKKAMKNRFSNILDTAKKRKGIVVLCAAAVLVFTGGMLVSCNQAKQISTLRIEAGEGGTIPAGQETEINGDYEEGTTVSIIAREMPDYYFVNWTSSNGGTFADANDSQTTFSMPGKDTIVTAHFNLIENTENQNVMPPSPAPGPKDISEFIHGTWTVSKFLGFNAITKDDIEWPEGEKIIGKTIIIGKDFFSTKDFGSEYEKYAIEIQTPIYTSDNAEKGYDFSKYLSPTADKSIKELNNEDVTLINVVSPISDDSGPALYVIDNNRLLISLNCDYFELEKISSEIDNFDNHNGYKTENDFLYSPEGLQFRKTAYGAAKAMLSADAEELAQFLIDPSYATRAVRNLTDIFDDLAVMTLKFSLENSVISDDEIRTSYEYLLKGDDSYTYVSMTLLKVDGEWKASEIGLEK